MNKFTNLLKFRGFFLRPRTVEYTSTYVTVSRSLRLGGKHVLLEADRELGMLRIRQTTAPHGTMVKEVDTFQNYIKCNGIVGVVPDLLRVEMKLADDGWWYGYYRKPEQLPLLAIDYDKPEIQAINNRLYISNKICKAEEGLRIEVDPFARGISIHIHNRCKLKQPVHRTGIKLRDSAQCLLGNQVITMTRTSKNSWFGKFSDEVGV